MNLAARRRAMERAFLGRAFLTLLSWIYGAAVRVRVLLYRLRLIPVRKLPVRTVCFGNITTGGAGKTTAVLLAAQLLRKKRHRIAILSRGYRRLAPGREVRVLLDSQSLSWEQVGDEPWMMHHSLHGLDVPILVSANRYKAGLEAAEHYDPQILLLDDGFQHLRLSRNLNILLINATDPFGGDHLLPRGNLREPLGGLRRAHLVLITHANQVTRERLEQIRDRILSIHPKVEVLEAAHQADFLFDLKSEQRLPLKHLEGKPVAAFSGIGDPKSFEDQLRVIDAELRQTWRFPDHHPYQAEELRSIESVRDGATLVTTFKDIPRLGPYWGEILRGEVLALAVRMEILKGQKTWEAELCKGLRASASED